MPQKIAEVDIQILKCSHALQRDHSMDPTTGNSLGQFMGVFSLGCGRWGFSLPPCGLLYVWHGNSRNSRIVRLFSAISAISAIFRYFSNVANTVAEDNADAGVWDTWSSLHFLVGVRKAKNIITQIFHNRSRNTLPTRCAEFLLYFCYFLLFSAISAISAIFCYFRNQEIIFYFS